MGWLSLDGKGKGDISRRAPQCPRGGFVDAYCMPLSIGALLEWFVAVWYLCLNQADFRALPPPIF